MMKLKTILITSLILLASTQAAKALPVGVAATVEGEAIYEAKLQKSIDYYIQQQGPSMGMISDPGRYKDVRNKILDVLIGQQLLWNAARTDNIIAQDDEVNRAFEQYKAQFDHPVKLQIKLTEAGYDEEGFRENLKQQLSAKKWLQQKVIREITINQNEIHEFYMQNQDSFIEPEQVRARHILIKLHPTAADKDRDYAMKRITDIQQELNAGAEFETMAIRLSEDSSSSKGGDLGYFGRGKMVRPFEEVAFALQPGQKSDIFQTRFGLHIVKLVDKKPAMLHPEEDMVDQIAPHIMKLKADLAVKEAISRLKQAARIELNSM